MNCGRLTSVDVDLLNREFDGKHPRELLEWASRRFGETAALCSAFGPEGMVLLHLLSLLERPIRVFSLDTGRLPEKTHELMEQCEKRYGISIELYTPEPVHVQEMIKRHGVNLFYRSVELRELCCEVRKVRPLTLALGGLSAWITGLRRSQSASRGEIQRFEIDTAHRDILKLNPLAGWSEGEVWEYITIHNLPYNSLHDRGYRSIGCAPCTRATNPGENIRAGRWWWEEGVKKECGIHLSGSGLEAGAGYDRASLLSVAAKTVSTETATNGEISVANGHATATTEQSRGKDGV